VAKRRILIDKLSAIPEIAFISQCSSPPSSASSLSGILHYQDGKNAIATDVQQKFGDTNYLKLYGLKLISGKNYASSDTITSLIVNETYSRALGFSKPDNAIGKMLDWGNAKHPITGVVSDFNQSSLHDLIKPLVIASNPSLEFNISVAFKPNIDRKGQQISIGKISSIWHEVYPKDDFEYTFFNDDIANYYSGEIHLASLLIWATCLAIFISCLGLLGFAIYTIGQRTKEISMRKVLGASIFQIGYILISEFLLLILTAFLIATPIAWVGIAKWLDNFSYRISMEWWLFILGLAVTLSVSMAILSYQIFKIAFSSPVKNLRTDG
jgi:ABC-type antimicrobial peptide transport system permease subunit